MLFVDLNLSPGTDNMAGVPFVAWVIPYSDVLLLPDYKKIKQSFEDVGTIFEDVIPKPYKTFFKIYATSDTGKVDDKKIKGKEGNSIESIYNFFFPKNDRFSLGFQRLSGSKFIFIVEETNGNKRILGAHPGGQAIIKTVTGTTGTFSSGDKGVVFQVSSTQSGPAPKYEGKFNLDRDNNDLSKYPVIWDTMIVIKSDKNGMPTLIDYYIRDVKVFSWVQTWNNNKQLTRRTIVLHVN